MEHAPVDAAVLTALERDPMRNIVLLKHIAAFPDAITVHHVAEGETSATLVLLDVAASPYDRRTYPTARLAALIASDDSALTWRLLPAIPPRECVVFKLSSDGDRDLICARHVVQRTTSVLSFTAIGSLSESGRGLITTTPSDVVLDLFASQEHARDWLEPLLATGKAFACCIGPTNAPDAVCFAFANYGPVWEIGGVFTRQERRGQGHAKAAVRATVAELGRRGLVPRYQVHDHNKASIGLAGAIGLKYFLTVTHDLCLATNRLPRSHGPSQSAT
jgi:GNAT superfamily N-acetyltransferase